MPVYIITHKQFQKYTDDISYKNVQVGAYRGHLRGEYFYDDEGDNISLKNANYCELTGLYWIWKNKLLEDRKSREYIGLVHYRRYFSDSFFGKKALSHEQINKYLEKGDIILPFNNVDSRTAEALYCDHSGFKSDLVKIRQIIEEKYPDYVSDYDSFFRGHDNYFFNMFITMPNLLDQYCKWLFDILFSLEKETDLTGYNAYQKRIYGFLGERLLNVWVRHNHLKVVEVSVVNTEERENRIKEILKACKRIICSGRIHQY